MPAELEVDFPIDENIWEDEEGELATEEIDAEMNESTKLLLSL